MVYEYEGKTEKECDIYKTVMVEKLNELNKKKKKLHS